MSTMNWIGIAVMVTALFLLFRKPVYAYFKKKQPDENSEPAPTEEIGHHDLEVEKDYNSCPVCYAASYDLELLICPHCGSAMFEEMIDEDVAGEEAGEAQEAEIVSVWNAEGNKSEDGGR